MHEKLFCLFPFGIEFAIDVVVILLRRLEIREPTRATFRFFRTLLGAKFHLFLHSPQTPMYNSEENKNSPNPSMQNAIGKEYFSASINEENRNHSYHRIHIVNIFCRRLAQVYLNNQDTILVFLPYGKCSSHFQIYYSQRCSQYFEVFKSLFAH